ncbi:MAG: hypothetical protein F6K19_36095 [Cyanothece sp. SIO1E1]|nr:hypothetical protein [Cyanothece sp. SIO1E1]
MQQTSFKTIFYRALHEAGCDRLTCSLLADVISRFLLHRFLPHDPRELRAWKKASAIVRNNSIRPGRVPQISAPAIGRPKSYTSSTPAVGKAFEKKLV